MKVGGRICAAAALLLLASPVVARAADTPPGCAPPQPTGGEWRTYGHDLSNTRNQTNEKIISAADMPSLTQAWVFSSVANGGEGDFTGTPIIADGCMYVASTRGWVFAVNADTGKLVWKTKVPYGGGVNSTVGVAERTLPASAVKGVKKRGGKCKRGYKRKGKRCVRSRKRRSTKHRRRAKKSAASPAKAGTIYVAVTRSAKAQGCPAGDPCIGPYAVALDQDTGKVAWASAAIDTQPGNDVYSSPIIYKGVVMLGISAGGAELGEAADRDAFQGNMNFLDADTGRLIEKTYSIHPPNKPNDDFAGGSIWSTPAIDTDEGVAYVGAGNPFKPQAEHAHTNAVLKFDVNPDSPKFGEILGSYKGTIDEYIPAFSQLPCYDLPGNVPPYYPQGLGSCGDIDMDFGAAPNLFRDASGRKLVGAGQKSGVYHVFDAKTMKPVWTQVVGPPTQFGGVVGSTAIDDGAIYGPITIPGWVWSISQNGGAPRWVGPIVDGLHWGPPVAVANGIVYSVDFQGFLDAFDSRTGVQLAKRPLVLGGGGPLGISWGAVSIARNTIYAGIGVLGLADGFIAAFKQGGPQDFVDDVTQTNLGSGGSGGGGGGVPVAPSVVSGPGAASVGYATPAMVMPAGGQLNYVNLDVIQHDVTSDDKDGTGKPIFNSKLIGLGESAPVNGVDKLQSGKSYGFFCSVHPGMRGTLAVQ